MRFTVGFGPIVLTCIALAGCAVPAVQPTEYLDMETAVTVSTVATPFIFARRRPELASNARDYATLAAVSVNRSGRIENLLLVYVWSTVDPRIRPEKSPDPKTLVVLADDRTLRFSRDNRTPREAGFSRPLHAPAGYSDSAHLYPVDVQTLRFIAGSGRLMLRFTDDERPFDMLWQDGRAALIDFAGTSIQTREGATR